MTELELGDGAGERGALLAAGEGLGHALEPSLPWRPRRPWLQGGAPQRLPAVPSCPAEPLCGERQVLPAGAAAASGYQLGLEAAAFAALPQPVWCIDAASRVLSANPAFCELAGCTQDGASSLPWTQLLLPLNGGAAACNAAAVQRLQAAAEAGQPAQESLQCRSATGALFCARVTLSPLPAVKRDGGAGPAFVCMLLGGPVEPPSSVSSSLAAAARTAAPPAAAPAPQALPGSPQGVAVPPQLAQLCNQALASTSESVLIMDATRPGQPICWVNKSFERLTGERVSAAGAAC